MHQIKTITSESAVNDAFFANPLLASLIVKYFKIKFDPDLFANIADPLRQRDQVLHEMTNRCYRELKNVRYLVQDRSFRSLLNLIDSKVRTNFLRTE